VIRAAILGLLFFFAADNAIAASITLESDSELSNKEFSIEARFQVLADGRLTGDKQDVTFDPLLDREMVKLPARFSIEGMNELGLDINLFECASSCKWHIALASFANPNARIVQNICTQREGSISGVYRQYFFCRKAFRRYFAAQGTCWPQTINALRGWFDAAYTLHIETLKEGISFVARDKEAEAFIKDSILACKDDGLPVLIAGYYNGMFVQLDRLKLQATQKVERLLKKGDRDLAKRWAEMIVQEIGVDGSIRNSISAAEIRYIEAILNRALQTDPLFILP
jgi:hypothetical protein